MDDKLDVKSRASRVAGKPRPDKVAPLGSSDADVVAQVDAAVADAMQVMETAAIPGAPPVPRIEFEAATSPAVASDQPVSEPLGLPVEEGSETMATIASMPTPEKAQALFGEMGERMKALFEKSSRLGEEMVDLTKGNVEAMVASARVAAKSTEALGTEAADYGRKSMESAVALMKSYASVKSPTELFQLQSEFVRASFDSAVAEASKLSESMLKIAGEVAQPLSTRYAVAAEKIKSAAA